MVKAMEVQSSQSVPRLTVWTDIEAECDGVLNYDRVMKFSEAEAALIRDMSIKMVGKPVACTTPAQGPFDYPRWMV